jgi:hypothetical protein
MALKLRTISQLISHYTQLESNLTKIYEKFALEYPEQAEVFKKFAKENKKYVDMVTRSYYEGVTDAFEVGFMAEPLNPDEYTLKKNRVRDLVSVLDSLIVYEETVIRFYVDVSKGSSELLPHIPDTFEHLIRRKRKRVKDLKKMMNKE